ncbi:GAF domain-containing sensor histidine kinase [Anaeromyxobacter oryzae]|uniref:histidine kinase n=1 Tax=Anaeromyxobacter oryzae TaxID=2918170 RepID=A0ABN6MMI5_9BACT|nr:HAMP domain-containing sensor histidine kinase [Anaeromyxobacter oryzae]BDG02171.1 hypothetical protein AMOR_11670 [Anaeromyxobacter oryzae]
MSVEWPEAPAEPWAIGEPARAVEEFRRRGDAAAAAERGIADRFARLHATTAALSAAVTPGDVAAVIAIRGHALPGATACWVGLLAEGGRDVHVAGHRGALEQASGRALVPVTADLPVAAAVRERRAIFLQGGPGALAAQARVCGFPAGVVRSLAALPLAAGERILGAIAVAFGAPQPFDEEERAFLEAFAHQCGQALDRARLYEAERASRLEAQRAEEAARRAVELQERLVGVVGHDLRTPLAAIRMAAGLLGRRGGLSEEQARTLSRLGASADRMTRIIRDLLDFTRIRSEGAIPLEPREMDLAEVARRAVAELQEVHPDREIALDLPASAPASGDPERLAQVISNLVGNAIQHSPPGAPVRVALWGEGAAHVVAVHNRGPPIPRELTPEIFEAFRRGPHDMHDASGSVGLGLFIVRELVRAHGGAVEVDSSEEDGTTFTVRLPVHVPGWRVPTGPPAPER